MYEFQRVWLIGSFLCLMVAFVPLPLSAEEDAIRTETTVDPKSSASKNALTRLSNDDEVWLDMKNKRVVVGGTICLQKGMLEMFACPKQTKEHESIVSVNSKAYLVHTALLAVGAEPGSPVQYDPHYKPAAGPKVKIEVMWKDADGKTKSVKAQEMIRHIKTGKPMEYEWVFGGSLFWNDETTGKKYYQAESGELICVSNFSTAMLDLPVQSSQNTANLLFEAFTENIPPLGTKVRLVLTPELPAAARPTK